MGAQGGVEWAPYGLLVVMVTPSSNLMDPKITSPIPARSRGSADKRDSFESLKHGSKFQGGHRHNHAHSHSPGQRQAESMHEETAHLEIHFLADCTIHVRQLASWLASEWGGGHPDAELRFERELAQALNRDRFPAALIALSDGQPAGLAILKLREVEGLPAMEHWMGGLYVAPAYRGRGLAAALIRHAERAARRMGASKLHLYTRSKQALYERLGWRHVMVYQVGARPASIMARDL